MNMTLPSHTHAAKRGIVVCGADSWRRLRNYSPRVQAPGSKPSTCSKQAFTGPDCAGLESDCHRGRRLDVCLW